VVPPETPAFVETSQAFACVRMMRRGGLGFKVASLVDVIGPCRHDRAFVTLGDTLVLGCCRRGVLLWRNNSKRRCALISAIEQRRDDNRARVPLWLNVACIVASVALTYMGREGESPFFTVPSEFGL
jgi:hypothetical protein